MGLYSQIAAFVAVSAYLTTRMWQKIREEPANEGEGNLIGNLPAIYKAAGLRMKQISFRDQTNQGFKAMAKAEIHTGVGIKFQIEVPAVTGHGGEKELKTAVLARLSEG